MHGVQSAESLPGFPGPGGYWLHEGSGHRDGPSTGGWAVHHPAERPCACLHGPSAAYYQLEGSSKSQVIQSCLTLATPWTVACQAPLSMGFSRQE